jgi:hypothetical protein
MPAHTPEAKLVAGVDSGIIVASGDLGVVGVAAPLQISVPSALNFVMVTAVGPTIRKNWPMVLSPHASLNPPHTRFLIGH